MMPAENCAITRPIIPATDDLGEHHPGQGSAGERANEFRHVRGLLLGRSTSRYSSCRPEWSSLITPRRHCDETISSSGRDIPPKHRRAGIPLDLSVLFTPPTDRCRGFGVINEKLPKYHSGPIGSGLREKSQSSSNVPKTIELISLYKFHFISGVVVS